jgi:hypothetical protein
VDERGRGEGRGKEAGTGGVAMHHFTCSCQEFSLFIITSFRFFLKYGEVCTAT